MAAPDFQLTMRSGPTPGKTFVLDQEENFVGRDLANDIAISDPEVSRRHARFTMREGSIFVEDVGSTNGSFLNGERITTPQQLRPGDVITLGESIVLIFEKVTTPAEDATVGIASNQEPFQRPYPEQPAAAQPAPEQMPVEPQAYQPSRPKQQTPTAQPQQAPPAEGAPERKRGLPSWMVILIVAIVVLICIIAVTLWFMPASWWCAIDIFNLLAGCPVP